MRARVNNPISGFRQRAFSEALFMSIGDGVFVTDSEARLSRINQKALEILGYKEKEVLGKWFPEIIPARDDHKRRLSNTERPIGQVFLTGKTITERAYYRRKNGSWIPVTLTVSPVYVDGKPVGAIEVFRDITDVLALERAKDEFVAIASHQLRTPATAVKQYVGLLLEGYAGRLDTTQKQFLEKAYESNERQLQIVQEILKVTQLDLDKVVLNPAVVDIRQIIQKAADGLSGKFSAKRQKITVNLPKEPVKAKVDAQQIQIALENLLENASNYTWENKTITISCVQAGNSVEIYVKDQGVGIAAADYPRLFQKFSRIENPLSLETNGTGLGLYWAASIIELHGGTISVKSSVGRGTTFIITLPDGV